MTVSLVRRIRANMLAMIERVLLVAWKGSQATQWLETLRAGGYTVLLEDTTGERAWRTAKERGIHAVIIDGQKKPSHGRQTGHALRDTRKTEGIPIIWTNLGVEDASGVKQEVFPDMVLEAPTNAAQALEALHALAARHKPPAQPEAALETADPGAPPDPTLHAHVHSLMGTPAYVAAWTERPAEESHIIDPDALPVPAASAPPAEAEPTGEKRKKAPAKKTAKPAAKKTTAKASPKKSPVSKRKTTGARPAAKTTRAAARTPAKKATGRTARRP